MIYNYPHPEKFEKFDKPDLKGCRGNIVVWGAGKIGGIAAHCLKKQDVEIRAFCDIAEDKWGKEFCGYTVISPEQLYNNYPDATVIVSTVFYATIVQELIQKGYKNIYDCSSLFLEIDFEGYDFWMLPQYAIRNVEQYMATIYEQKYCENKIDQIFLNITTKCSLRCRDCSMFIPYIKEPCFYDANTMMEDLNKVLEVLGHIRILNFYGGEPLLHPKLADMMEKLRDDKRIERISVITNATILPDKKLLATFKEDGRILIRISDYGKLSSKMEIIRKLFEEEKIAYEVSNYAYWDAPSRIAPTMETEQQLFQKFQQCTAGNNLFFLNRKIYLCSTGSAVDNMEVFPPSETNYVDVGKYGGDLDNLKQKLNEYIGKIHKREYLDACNYCSGSHCVQFEDKRPVAIQTKELLNFEKLY